MGRWTRTATLVLVLFCTVVGCRGPIVLPAEPYPHETNKAAQASYVIEPPDVLVIEALRTVPISPYLIQPFDTLLVRATETLPNEPIEGLYVVDPDGTINLGASYGSVKVVDQTKNDAQAAIKAELQKVLVNTEVTLGIVQTRAQQQIRGEHLVYPDGTINLGLYGSVYVTNLTIAEAKAAIESQLSPYLERPEVAVSVGGFNSKLIYVITDGGGYGEQVVRLPSTGNETVLDAMAQINGLAPQASKHKIWVARPSDDEWCQTLPVDWEGITRLGDPTTNYQLLPGDRIYIQADGLIALGNWVGKLVTPVERVLGVTLLGSATVSSIENGGRGGGFGF